MPFPPPPSDGFKEADVLWIFGHPRSGTTWLANLLRVGLGMKLWNEPYLGQILLFRNTLAANDPTRIEDETFWFSDPQEENWKASVNLLFTDVVARQAGPRHGYTGLVLKEPNGSISAPWIVKAMPDAKSVFMVRDIRDVIASLIDARKPGSWMDQRLTQEFDRMKIVKQSVRRMYRIAERMAQVREIAAEGRYYEMRYERLRANTFDEMFHLAHHFGVPVDADELRNAVDKLAIENLPDEEKGPGKFIRKGEVGGWRNELEWGEIDHIQRHLGDMLDHFGYEKVSRGELG
jgi:hypothetical protein